MSQIDPLYSQVVTDAETALGVLNRAKSDKFISSEEVVELQYAIERTLFTANKNSVAMALGSYIQRAGPYGDRADRMENLWDRTVQLEPERPRLTIVARNDFPVRPDVA